MTNIDTAALKPEAGKYYRTASGEIVGPIVWDSTIKVWRRNSQYSRNTGDYWHENGSRFGHIVSDEDLVEEVSIVGPALSAQPAQDVVAVLVKWKRFDYSITNERMIETVNGSFTLHSEVMRTITRLEEERDAARDALEHDRSAMITAVNQFNDAFARRSWLLTSRGSYEWDDDRYREEFRGAYDELALPIEKLREMGKDWSNCPTDHDAIMQARIDWKSRAEKAEASLAEMQKVVPVVFGNGDRVVTTGTYDDHAAVFIVKANNPGEVGKDANADNAPVGKLLPGEIVFIFPTKAQAKTVSDALCNTISTDALTECQNEKAALQYQMDEMTADRNRWQTAHTECQKREAGLREACALLENSIRYANDRGYRDEQTIGVPAKVLRILSYALNKGSA